jgi:DNA polymerase-3 subunit alpha
VFRTVQEFRLGIEHAQASIIETEDGERWLYLNSETLLTPHLWERAVAEDAAGIVAANALRSFSVVLAEDVQEALSGSLSVWTMFPDPPTYVEAVKRLQERPEAVRGTFVHVHTHTEYSALDGLSTAEELAGLAAADGNPALAVTDHGTCAGHPALQRACDKAGIKPIFGMEAYFVDDRLIRPGPRPVATGDAEVDKAAVEQHAAYVKQLRYGYKHLILLAKDDVGLRNLWALSTEGFRDGYYGKPRIDWDSLRRHSQGLIATSACLGGPLAQLLLGDRADDARALLARFLDIFGRDFYLEVQPGDQDDQRILNRHLVKLGRELNVPLVAAADGHFPTAADHEVHKVWMECQTSKDTEDYWHFDPSMSEAEMRAGLSHLDPQAVDEAVENTVRIADRCDARIESKIVMPVYYRQGGYDRDAQKLRQVCEGNWHRIRSAEHDEQTYRERFEREFDLISRKKYCGYFLMVADYVCWAKDGGILVGPGRGSGAGSLIAFLTRITEVDPVEHDILFERFITEGRETLPDFDVDFPASKRPEIQDYIRAKYGDDRVLRVGTHLRYKSKGVIGKLFSVFRDRGEIEPEAFGDAQKISAIIAEAEAGTAGLGLSWEELWAQEGDQLEPYRLKYRRIFELAERLVGRLNSYGKHPAGMVISTEGSLLDKLPLRRGDDDGMMITQFEFDDLDSMGLIKFDILTIRTLDTLQATVDGARQHFGIDVNVYDFDPEYGDPMIWDEIGAGHTLGMFQIETASGTRLARRMLPASISDLADMGSIVRPGPMRSGLTEAYLRRRAGEEPVEFPDPRLEEFLAPTQGVMIFQEQVMQACMTLAGYDSTEADAVRKILGKKQVDKVAAAGHKFVDGCVANGMDRNAAILLWDQMSEFAKYGFGKAHAVSYAMITYWTAWWKTHYPVPALTALLSTVDKERVPEFVKEARRLGVAVLPPDINASGRGFKPDGPAIRYGLDAIKGIGDKAVEAIVRGQPYTGFEDYLEGKGGREPEQTPGRSLGSSANAGVTLLLARVGAFDSVAPHRRGLVDRLEAEKDGTAARCVFKTADGSDRALVCGFDWESEPRPVGRTGKKLKAKPLPKKCTKGCRQYVAPEPVPLELSASYTDKEIRVIEQEMLGVQLSSTPFDSLESGDRKALLGQADLLDKGLPGFYTIAGTVTRLRKHRDRTDRDMAFFGLATEVTDIDVVAFADAYTAYKHGLTVGGFVLCELKRDHYGAQLKKLIVLDD